MSLILEALKKSEQQRRLGEAPTLGSPALLARRRRSALPLLALLVLLAAGAGWWLLRTPPPAGPVDTPVADSRPNGTPGQPPAVAPARSAPAPSTPAPAERKPVLARAHPAPVAEPETPAEKAAALARAIAQRERGLAAPAPVPPADRPGQVVAPPASSLTRPNLPPAQATPPAQAPAATGATATPHAKNAPVAAPHTPSNAPAQPAHAAPAPPLVWELPYAARKELPDLTLTLHMYAADPHERFVVIHGERHVEGDDLGDGLILREIRPDGVVLDFKGQRFLYPRDGR
jgi:general secretion pathway protein B